MSFKRLYLILYFFLNIATFGFAQSGSCPPNISFENGNFTNWQAATGSVLDVGVNNVLTLTPSQPVNNRHTIYNRNANPGLDPYGNFPRNSPDGGQYSVRLGNDGNGRQAEQLNYTFTVPANQPDFTITYYYAVVFQDPSHTPFRQPRFTARVFDVAANKYIPCASFEYIATSQLPGFQKSSTGANVYFKDWSPVTINLSEYSGKQIKLEFTTADCTEGGHFGYAYVDVADECLGAITGNSYCGTPSSVTLKGPSGFERYNWYNADLSSLLGKNQTLTISPAPSANTRFALQLVPYPGFGCLDTVYSTIQVQPLAINIVNPPGACWGSTVDLTAPSVTSGSISGLTYSYWKDLNATIKLDNPDKVATSGLYYIKAVSDSGCSTVKPVTVTINPLIEFTVTSPTPVCAPSTIDITTSSLITGEPGLTFTYWTDALATIPLTNAKAVSAGGTYFIKGEKNGCFNVKPVTVTINPLVNLVTVSPPGVCQGGTVDLTAQSVTLGSNSGLTYSYWKDSNATIKLDNPDKVDTSGQYYIKAVNLSGCTMIKPVQVTIIPLPEFSITPPAAVCEPLTVDITDNGMITGEPGLTFTYWRDASATIPLTNPQAVSVAGTYYIKGQTALNCSSVKPVQVVINKVTPFTVATPKPVYFPSTVDLTRLVNNGSNLTYSYSHTPSGSQAIDSPEKIDAPGTYYVIGTNQYGCTVSAPVIVRMAPIPKVFVPTAFTPLLPDNNRLFPFLVAVKTLLNFKIYNKWGTLVYQTSNATEGWDGYYQSELHFFETYTWYLEGIDELDNYFKKTGKSILAR